MLQIEKAEHVYKLYSIQMKISVSQKIIFR